MAIKFEFPVKLPRFTTAEFEQKKRDYNAKYGYRIHIPGVEDIVEWKTTPEPTIQELDLYKKRKVAELGEGRYDDIKNLMQEKRENFLRMMDSPSPDIIRSAATALTFLDDINDTLGTFGCVARILAHKLPASLGKLLLGPAGWLFTAADVINIGMTLSRLPWKARRLQHELHATIKDLPLTKKAKLRMINKLKRAHLSKGEIIEALQTTDNIFGVGLCLGPIMGLVYDIPSGLYRQVMGKQVKITGLPAPLLWFDRVWANCLRSHAQMWTGVSGSDDAILGKNMVAYNLATQMQKAYLQDTNPIDVIEDLDGIELPVPMPAHPSTEAVILAEVSSIEEYSNWPVNGKKWMGIAETWDRAKDEITDNVKAWMQRNNQDTVSMICAQNAVEAGMNTLAICEGDDDVETDHDATSTAMLKLLNQNYRFPITTTQEQLGCVARQTAAYDAAGLQPETPEILKAVKDNCGFEFTTEVPDRNSVPYSLLHKAHDSGIWRLQSYYFAKCVNAQNFITGPDGKRMPQYIPSQQRLVDKCIHWLQINGWNTQSLTPWVLSWPPEMVARLKP